MFVVGTPVDVKDTAESFDVMLETQLMRRIWDTGRRCTGSPLFWRAPRIQWRRRH